MNEFFTVKDRFLGDVSFPLGDEVMAPMIAKEGIWEAREADWLKKVVRPGSTCLNVGANVGYFSCWMSKLAGKEGHVIAVEPNPTLQPLLMQNLSDLSEGTFEVLPVAAGSENGVAELFINSRNFGDSTLLDPRNEKDGDSTIQRGFDSELQSVIVPLHRLDELLTKHDIDVILIDTQGYDHKVIDGLRATIARSKPQILLEFVPGWISNQGLSPRRVVRGLQKMGYDISCPELSLHSPSSASTLLRTLDKSPMWFTNLQLSPKAMNPSFLETIQTLRPLLSPRNTWREFLRLRELEPSYLNLVSTHTQLEAKYSEALLSLRFAEHFGKSVSSIQEKTSQRAFGSWVKTLKIANPKVPLLRIGSHNDGGYVLPDVIGNLTHAFSAGIADNSDFEFALAELGVPVSMLDFSVDGPARNHALFQFTKAALAPATAGESFLSLEDWLKESGIESTNILLKLDIEGSEWRVLDAAPPGTLSRFEVIVLEFHWFESMKDLWSFSLVQGVFDKLLSLFDLVHVHGNNYGRNIRLFDVHFPEVLEATFLRKGAHFGNKGQEQRELIDSPNNPDEDEIKLDSFWGIS